ncbi:unnamed protein product [Bursaphelenchus xylophilus]|uniref:(pine wood nematode) hypothetical protein n=1 Tax=Bursaphelenchus xylophilus TaxID=6326 RepID=A0A1I7SLA7_BURXY|nr:unnamed protein product [Bursaphelenchus xylophilus]CAG9129450.1 unnamed protein product [Bursaphelenchus xylophilus]
MDRFNGEMSRSQSPPCQAAFGVLKVQYLHSAKAILFFPRKVNFLLRKLVVATNVAATSNPNFRFVAEEKKENSKCRCNPISQEGDRGENEFVACNVHFRLIRTELSVAQEKITRSPAVKPPFPAKAGLIGPTGPLVQYPVAWEDSGGRDDALIGINVAGRRRKKRNVIRSVMEIGVPGEAGLNATDRVEGVWNNGTESVRAPESVAPALTASVVAATTTPVQPKVRTAPGNQFPLAVNGRAGLVSLIVSLHATTDAISHNILGWEFVNGPVNVLEMGFNAMSSTAEEHLLNAKAVDWIPEGILATL